MNGTLQDVAAFFRVHPKTVHRWIHEEPPRLTHFRLGRAILVDEEAVLAAVMGGRVGNTRGVIGADRETVRGQWRSFVAERRGKRSERGGESTQSADLNLASSAAFASAEAMAAIELRLARLEALLNPQGQLTLTQGG
jgi:hypothetical protein